MEADRISTPPLPPRKPSPLCSVASSVLWRSPTPPKRTCPDDGSFTFPDRSARADALEVSRFSCTLLPGGHRVFDYAEPSAARDITRFASVAFPLTEKVGTRLQIFGAQCPARQYLCLRFAVALADNCVRLEARMESLLLSCRALSSPTMCRFIPALPVPSMPERAIRVRCVGCKNRAMHVAGDIRRGVREQRLRSRSCYDERLTSHEF